MSNLKVYEQAKLGPNDVQVVELHDCFSCNEVALDLPSWTTQRISQLISNFTFVKLVTYEGLGLCPVGEAAKLIDSGNTTYGTTKKRS